MCASWLSGAAGTCNTTTTAACKSSGRVATSSLSAGTPPADAPTTTTARAGSTEAGDTPGAYPDRRLLTGGKEPGLAEQARNPLAELRFDPRHNVVQPLEVEAGVDPQPPQQERRI